MTVRQTQLSYDDHWHGRKSNLGKKATWQIIVRAGIITLEEMKRKGQFDDAIANLKVDRVGEQKVEATPEQKVQSIKIVLKSEKTPQREFDVLRENKWETVTEKEIGKNEVLFDSYIQRLMNSHIIAPAWNPVIPP